LYSKDAILTEFLHAEARQDEKRHIVVFHCEFSSERAPKLWVDIFSRLLCR